MADDKRTQTKPESAQARTVFLVLVCFLVGIVAGAYWMYRATSRNAATANETSFLSAGTKAVLGKLTSPVEIRFYSLLDPATTSDTLRNFADRASQLTAEIEREAGGKIKLTRETTRSDAATTAASADGIKAFNLEKGDACYLGLAVIGKDRREVLSQLSPDWEAALESDLSRAILRVAEGKPAAKTVVVSTAPIDATVISEVKRAIPNLESVSLAEATQTLRAAGLKEIVTVTEQMQRRVQEAQQRLAQLQGNATEAEQQAALKQLQQVQAEQADKIKQVSAKVQAQVDALQQIKGK